MSTFTKMACKNNACPTNAVEQAYIYFPKVESDAHILLQYRLNLLVMAGQYVFKNVVGDIVHS